jgi:hypothetical protein
MKRILALLLLASICFSESHPLFLASSANARENITVYTMKSFNGLNTPTTAYRVWLDSGFDWFDARNLTYPFSPDGIEGFSPYWDLPPILPNESMEVSFSVRKVVGLPESIDVRTQELGRWNGSCGYLKPFNSSTSVFHIQGFLDGTNRTQDVTIYFDEGGRVLARLEGYRSFVVFSINGTHVVPLSDELSIRSLVQGYVLAAGPAKAEGDTSALHKAILMAEDLKEKPEAECYKLTGMDRYPCVDRKSCMFSCFSVPVCSALGESGWSFMDTIMDYNKSVEAANQKLIIALDSSKEFDRSPAYPSAKKAFEDLVVLNRAETTVIFHPLFTVYGFCEPPKYGIPQQTSARRELLDYLASTCLDGESGRIADEAIRIAPLLQARPEKSANGAVGLNDSRPAFTTQPANKTVSNGSIAPLPINETASSCCLGGICSIGGIERVGGACWEWPAYIVLAALVLASAFAMRKR